MGARVTSRVQGMLLLMRKDVAQAEARLTEAVARCQVRVPPLVLSGHAASLTPY
jgi:hypothetical protein